MSEHKFDKLEIFGGWADIYVEKMVERIIAAFSMLFTGHIYSRSVKSTHTGMTIMVDVKTDKTDKND